MPAGTPPDLVAAIEAFLLHLQVERGLSPATLSAYGADLRDFAGSPEARGGWERSPDPAIAYLGRLASTAGPSGVRIARHTEPSDEKRSVGSRGPRRCTASVSRRSSGPAGAKSRTSGSTGASLPQPRSPPRRACSRLSCCLSFPICLA